MERGKERFINQISVAVVRFLNKKAAPIVNKIFA